MLISSLRAKRSNPESFRGRLLDCFVASLLAMTEFVVTPSPRREILSPARSAPRNPAGSRPA
ncbi:hypothetical protein FXB38_03980 [Bradyrhizobium cytisi]|uniref:Uncharacterized protein n=1 Tax=Bradyrhizobium cytisi TaxID=515489 RepID=A0A5S4XDU7_9BRAD|nr:hypothetical protein FXB38_03980 [Bradyrhizobium cytisi]